MRRRMTRPDGRAPIGDPPVMDGGGLLILRETAIKFEVR
jgi:hypothetical protein